MASVYSQDHETVKELNYQRKMETSSKTLPPNLNPKSVFENFLEHEESPSAAQLLRYNKTNSISGGSNFLSIPSRNLDYNSDDGSVQKLSE
jgi:hypothetical protein